MPVAKPAPNSSAGWLERLRLRPVARSNRSIASPTRFSIVPDTCLATVWLDDAVDGREPLRGRWPSRKRSRKASGMSLVVMCDSFQARGRGARGGDSQRGVCLLPGAAAHE